MTTIEKLRGMAEVSLFAHRKHWLLEAAAELEALTQERDDARTANRITNDELEALRKELREETEIVNKVWAALGIYDYLQAGGKTIWEHVEQLRTQNQGLREIAQALLCDSVVAPSEVQRFKTILNRIRELEASTEKEGE